MSVVFQSKDPYLQVAKGDVLRSVAVTGFRYNERTHEYENTAIIAGYYVKESSLVDRCSLYLFREGSGCNRLTLEDPVEIEKMREYIKKRKDDLIVELTTDNSNS